MVTKMPVPIFCDLTVANNRVGGRGNLSLANPDCGSTGQAKVLDLRDRDGGGRTRRGLKREG